MTVLLRLLTVFTVLLATALSALTYPTLYGDSGLVLAPTADVMPALQYQFAVDFTKGGYTSDGSTIVPIRLNYGIAQDVELAVLSSNFSEDGGGSSDFTAYGGTVKMALTKEDLATGLPAVAVGARGINFNDDHLGTQLDAYVVASKTVLSRSDLDMNNGFQLRAHAGLSYTKYTGAGDNQEFLSPFGGLSYENINGNALVIDLLSEQKKDSNVYRETIISGAFRIPVSPKFTMELGSTRAFGLADSSFYAGLMYDPYGK